MKKCYCENFLFDKMTAMRTMQFSYFFSGKAFHGPINSYHSFFMEQFDIMPTSCAPIGHLHEEMVLRKIIFDKMTAMRT